MKKIYIIVLGLAATVSCYNPNHIPDNYEQPSKYFVEAEIDLSRDIDKVHVGSPYCTHLRLDGQTTCKIEAYENVYETIVCKQNNGVFSIKEDKNSRKRWYFNERNRDEIIRYNPNRHYGLADINISLADLSEIDVSGWGRVSVETACTSDHALNVIIADAYIVSFYHDMEYEDLTVSTSKDGYFQAGTNYGTDKDSECISLTANTVSLSAEDESCINVNKFQCNSLAIDNTGKGVVAAIGDADNISISLSGKGKIVNVPLSEGKDANGYGSIEEYMIHRYGTPRYSSHEREYMEPILKAIESYIETFNSRIAADKIGINCKTLEVENSGDGCIFLSGNANNVKISVSGKGNVYLCGLNYNTMEENVTGEGRIFHDAIMIDK